GPGDDVRARSTARSLCGARGSIHRRSAGKARQRGASFAGLHVAHTRLSNRTGRSMQRTTVAGAIALVLLSACTGALTQEQPVVARWSLVAGPDGALLDVENPAAVGYPNARLFDRLDIRLRADGIVCAASESREWCGGPLEGIPYTVRARVSESDTLC